MDIVNTEIIEGGTILKPESEVKQQTYANLKELAYSWPNDGNYTIETTSPNVVNGELLITKDGDNLSLSMNSDTKSIEEIRSRLSNLDDYNGGDARKIVQDNKELIVADGVSFQASENRFIYKCRVSDDGSGQVESKAKQFLDYIPVFAGEKLAKELSRSDNMEDSSNREWVNKCLNEGQMQINPEKSIPVEVADNVSDLPNHIGNIEPGKLRLYHGTSLDSAIGMLRIGFFGRGPESQKGDFPSLSDKVDGIPSQFAANSSDKVIVVFDSDPGEFITDGGYGESTGVPGIKFEGDKSKLRAYLPDNLLSDQDLRMIPKEHIKKLIYLK